MAEITFAPIAWVLILDGCACRECVFIANRPEEYGSGERRLSRRALTTSVRVVSF